MIQLASDPNALRMQWRPDEAGKAPALQSARRNGHAWPFISSYAEKPAAEQQKSKPANEHGS